MPRLVLSDLTPASNPRVYPIHPAIRYAQMIPNVPNIAVIANPSVVVSVL